ncbi:MAG: hydrogen peroxide-inducible genes activator [Hyphomicrobiales bacterium]|jgi:LysR family hydrogen peroxide-inducible transcriptional activator|nr:hydrogen peroxide-inducible genes activator [Hyphomicrobiales bacterium]MCO5083103.1 hydrogen peroxide-inducible genes activator [Rhizobiaceae bacterium]
MIRLTLRQMQYFEALAETLHFGRAAELVGVTQPALSAQIAEMEQQLGFRLFERGRGVVHLTEEAVAYRQRIERILDDVRELETAALRERKALDGRFRLGIIPTIAPYLLPYLLPQLKREFPDLRIEIREAVTGAIVEDTLSGRLDGMIAAGPFDESTLAFEPLFEDRFLLAIPADEVGRVPVPVAPESVVFERLMLLEEGHCMREDALAICGRVKPVAMASFGATSLTTLLHMVGHGLGVTLLPEIAAGVTYGRPDVALVPFGDPVPSRTICLAWRKTSHRRRDHLLLAGAIRAAHGAVVSDTQRPKRSRTRVPA